MRSFTPLALLVILLLAPVGVGQVPPAPGAPTPVFTLTLSGQPAEFTGLAGANATATAPVHLGLLLTNVVCTAAVDIPVTITATPAGPPGYFSVAAEPSVINVTIEQGPHVAGVSDATGAGDAGVKATISGNITTNASVAVEVTASAAAPSECSGAGAVPSPTSAPVTIFANMTAPPPPPVEEPTPEDTPFVGMIALVGIAVTVALVRRRKA